MRRAASSALCVHHVPHSPSTPSGLGHPGDALCGRRGGNTGGACGLSGRQALNCTPLTPEWSEGGCPEGRCVRGRGGPKGSWEPGLSRCRSGKGLLPGLSNGFLRSWPGLWELWRRSRGARRLGGGEGCYLLQPGSPLGLKVLCRKSASCIRATFTSQVVRRLHHARARREASPTALSKDTEHVPPTCTFRALSAGFTKSFRVSDFCRPLVRNEQALGMRTWEYYQY